MSDPSRIPKLQYRLVEARRAGYLRRPEKDGLDYDAWEAPDGKIVTVRKGETLLAESVRLLK